jgi:hypothetical protein
MEANFLSLHVEVLHIVKVAMREAKDLIKSFFTNNASLQQHPIFKDHFLGSIVEESQHVCLPVGKRCTPIF